MRQPPRFASPGLADLRPLLLMAALIPAGLLIRSAPAAAVSTPPVAEATGAGTKTGTPGATGATATLGVATPGATATLGVTTLPNGTVELRSGNLVVARIPFVTPPLRRAPPEVREIKVDGHRIAELRVPVRGRPTEEVWIGEIGVKPVRVVWSGLAGPRDADEETAIAVEVTPDRIFEYQTAAQVSRCDGEPVRLFPRAWDFVSARFRPILSTPPGAAAQKLTARRDDPAMPTARPIGGFRFTAASTTTAAGNDARGLSAPSGLDDGDPKTGWAEGLGGDGRGEFLTARASAGHYRVRGLRMIPGDASTAAAFKSKNRIKSLALALGPDPARRFDVEFPEDPAAAAAGKFATPYWIALPTPVDSACVTVVIRDVYRGSEAGASGGGGTTAISDLQIFTELDQPAGVERLVTDMATGIDCPSRVPLLVALGEPAVLPAAQAILTPGATGVGRECLVESLSRIDATLKSGVAMDALVAALVGASPTEERLITQTVRKAQGTGTAPVNAAAALLASPRAAAADRARAARLLGQLDAADAANALVAATGGTEPETRLAIVQALGRAPAATASAVVAAIDAARDGQGEAWRRREADLSRALPALARRGPADHAAAVASLRRSLASSPSFEVRARAVLALGDLGDTGTVSDLSAVRDQSDDAVLRFLAARELGSIGGTAAMGALRNALGDLDPRVRETAAQGLGFHKDVASEAVLIAAAKEEPWPFARRAQIEALSHTCGPQARDLLMRAMERDVDEVQRASLVGLVRCRDGRARNTLLATLKNRHASAALRELAGALLGELGDHDVTRELADTLATLVNEAEGDLAIEGVTVSALRALGHLGGPDAARAAAFLTADVRHPYQREAIEALGEICDADAGARALRILCAGKDAALAAEAQNAAQKCQDRGARTPATPPP